MFLKVPEEGGQEEAEEGCSELDRATDASFLDASKDTDDKSAG